MSDQRLARVVWQSAKMLVSLLEKEYGLGKSKPIIGIIVQSDPTENYSTRPNLAA